MPAMVTVNILKHENVDEDFVFSKSMLILLKDIETCFKQVNFQEERAKLLEDKVMKSYTITLLMPESSH